VATERGGNSNCEFAVGKGRNWCQKISKHSRKDKDKKEKEKEREMRNGRELFWVLVILSLGLVAAGFAFAAEAKRIKVLKP
jgi:hypothetical protein